MAVLGPGLIGGSVLRAVRQRDPGVTLTAWARRPEAVAELLESGAADFASTSLPEAIAGADALILAMPIGHMAAAVRQIDALAGPDGPVHVTDVGSVKGSVVCEIGGLVRERGGIFLGSHPMAGSEKKGLGHADPDLFEGAAVILTPEADAAGEVELWSAFWQGLGGIVSVMSPDRHDDIVAGISHLPHLLAAALVRSVLGPEPGAVGLSGGGFRDTTRVAGGPEEMWAGILGDNATAVSAQLSAFQKELGAWKDALDRLDTEALRGFLSEARRLRETLPGPGGRRPFFETVDEP